MKGIFSTVNLPVRFISSGLTVAGAGWIHPERLQRTHELIVVRQGRFGLNVNGRDYVLSAGQAFLLPSGLRCAGFHPEGEEAPVYYWARFEEEDLSGRDAEALKDLSVTLPSPVFDRTVSAFHHLVNRSGAVRGRSELCDYLLSVVLLEIRQDEEEAPRSAVADRMLEYIRLHCFEKLSWRDLSLALGYTEDYLSRQFHEYMNCSFRQYVHQLRMDRARRELLDSKKSVQQIAEECGYGNARFFSTVFMRYEGISPSAYRNRCSSVHQTAD